VNEAIDETRRISKNLRPSSLDDLGLLRTINGLCREVEQLSGIHVKKDIHIIESQVPELLKITIFRILQEALNNAVKHSEANHVHVHLTENAGNVELTVEDKGKGFSIENREPGDTAATGMGIDSMKERAELTGGLLKLWSEPGKGTVVRAMWPYTGKTATS
jgi:two-component system NarL family sensor kinase